ncbi:Cation efflux protein [Penicillium griseofulvum]|uniref:Zinc transporter n=1 Tax=Penicillium patulum TaxID=5078 RepID=A0A135LWL5_PENPA|nr:Cation efflux protein [Penicillium griseofulvum]KXG53311.1 Cation efflux protein [Penicillium griseofulvum]
MSTGAPSLSVDLTPPSIGHSHNHGHSRGHGHSRSNRWAQPPPPLSQPAGAGFHEHPEPINAVNSSYSYGHTRQPSDHGHTHAHAHSHSSAHHNHNHSVSSLHHNVLDDHHLKGGVHGMLSTDSTVQAGRSSEKVPEYLTSALIMLPWVALSWYQRQYAQSQKLSGEGIPGTIANIPVGQVGQKTCFLTAITLVLFGCGQILRINHYKAGSSSLSSVNLPKLNAKSVQASLSQIVSVALPIFAAIKIGGFLVAFALLLATASGIPAVINGAPRTQEKYSRKILSIALLVVVIMSSFFGLNHPWDVSPFIGYAALLGSVFVTPPPFPSLRHNGPIPEPGIVAAQSKSSHPSNSSVVITTDAPLAIIGGASLALLTILFNRGFIFSISDLMYLLIPTGIFAISLMISLPPSLRSPQKAGLAICAGAAAVLCAPHAQDDLLMVYATRGILATASFFASRRDDIHLHLDTHAHNHTHGHSHSHTASGSSRISKWLLRKSEPYALLHSILKEKDSRSIFYFMCLNFTFMLIQLSYGFITGSLGLLSDSIHMFFDCFALVVGLCAAVMSKWPPNARFPYGYGKVDTLSGFANGIFLMIISVEIIYEAVERLSSGSEVHRLGELLMVSIAGLAVNLVGIFSFEHGHAHHGHDHDHSHGNENMHGIFLHILADTLGSVAVVISTILVHYSGWAGYDPLASCFIAVLIFASAVPLVSSTAKSLLLTLPGDTEYNVRETLAGVSTLRGVERYLPDIAIPTTILAMETVIIVTIIAIVTANTITIMSTTTPMSMAILMLTAMAMATVTVTITTMRMRRNPRTSSG